MDEWLGRIYELRRQQLGYGMIKGRHATSEQYIKYIAAELAELRHERETRHTEANWRDWEALLTAERANTTAVVRQRDEALAELAIAIAVRDDNEAVAVERLERLALFEADADALALALLHLRTVLLYDHKSILVIQRAEQIADTALAAHEAL